MRLTVLSLTLAALCAFAACASSSEQRTANQTNASTTTAAAPSANAPVQPPADAYHTSPVVPAHGGSPSTSAPPAASNEETGMNTAALDAKIEKAEAKAKAKNATQADKLAAASAYMERADIFMHAGKPPLYKYALRDYRRTLRYQPDNEQARQSVKTLVDIYNSMGRPVPELGNEP